MRPTTYKILETDAQQTTTNKQEPTIMSQEPTVVLYECGCIDESDITTEERLSSIRATMKYYKPFETFGRLHGRIPGYYYTEPIDTMRV